MVRFKYAIRYGDWRIQCWNYEQEFPYEFSYDKSFYRSGAGKTIEDCIRQINEAEVEMFSKFIDG